VVPTSGYVSALFFNPIISNHRVLSRGVREFRAVRAVRVVGEGLGLPQPLTLALGAFRAVGVVRELTPNDPKTPNTPKSER